MTARDLFFDAFDYTLDTWQRAILFCDTLRRRGDIAQERERLGYPPVLKYDYEVIMDGRTLPRPVNYVLLKIRPKHAGANNARMRPFIIVDPRAGHGPGIGGFKDDSEIGVALRAGHPVYFVSFFPRPEPGQTLMDVGAAEAAFIEEVGRRHPEADKPCVIANCQAGWAVAALSSVRPEIMGPIILSGSPLAYWSGASGKNPMRYSGGLLGGKWMESLACDLGNGLFDGIHLVQNFENLNPSNSYWTKYYNLYAKIDSETERFLDFETWWTGYFLLNASEMDAIVSELFIGNKLARGMIKTDSGTAINLRNIRSPLVIFASEGDNISPPQQALNWIEDVYGSERSVIESGRVIVYLIHESIGHLGVFVSAGVAKKEYSQLVETMEMIDALPPGLYEMMIEPGAPVPGWEDLHAGPYRVRFEARTMSDIHALDDGREEEGHFAAVDSVSKIGDFIYGSWFRPWVQFFSNEFTAEILRSVQPLRVQQKIWSALNPFLTPVAWWAPIIREHRRPAPEQNLFRIQEEAVSEMIKAALDGYRDVRDTWIEYAFRLAYGSFGWGALFPPESPVQAPAAPEEPLAIPDAAWTSGGQLAAILRMIAAVSLDIGVYDSRSPAVFRNLLSHSAFRDVTITEIKAIFRQQTAILRCDPQRAVDALRDMLLDLKTREEAVRVFLEVLKAIPEACGMQGPLGHRIRETLQLKKEDLQKSFETAH